MGGGAIGLLTAYYLRRAGLDVTVLERDRVGRGCSWGNLGWVCPSISTPLAAPGLGVASLFGALGSDSPLYIRPSSIPALTPWLLRFRSHCNADDYAAGCIALARLNDLTMDLYDGLLREGVAFEHYARGMTFVASDSRALEDERRMIEDVGVSEVASWSAEQLLEREPALPPAFAGALHVASDRHVRGDSLCAGVAEALVGAGGRLEEGFEVSRARLESGTVVALEGPGGPVEADSFVFAAGAETGRVAPGGAVLGLQAGKGYSITVHRPRLRLTCPLYICDVRIGLTPYRDVLRVGGTMELSGINRRLDPRRVQSIRRQVLGLVPDALEGEREVEWVGMRPLTPDGLPSIGRLPGTTNAYVAAGHQMLGITLAPATGHALARLIAEGAPGVPLEPFEPGRFAD